MIFVYKHIIPENFCAITLYPFIFCKDNYTKNDIALVNHEKIHLKQQAELLVIFFYVIYVFEWLIKLIKYRNSYIAYRNISFEREAYDNESDFDYLTNKKVWSFLKYL